MTGFPKVSNRRVRDMRPLIPPQILLEELPLTSMALDTVAEGRLVIENILSGADDRLLVIVGPCSIHDLEAAKDYAHRLRSYAELAKDDLHVVMRVSFERPRRTPHWRGLVNDPEMNGSSQINKGIRLARRFLLDLANMGLPAACEWLDVIIPQYTSDLVSWGAIGARATESQVHRELASGLGMPVGFKNSTDGTIGIAVDACKASLSSHCFLTVGKEGLSSIVETDGNPDVHVILRGGTKDNNYDEESIAEAISKLKNAGIVQQVMIDCSHGNSPKTSEGQQVVAECIAKQLESGSTAKNILGVMLESNIVEGRQDLPASGRSGLVYGQSITDACVSWETTVELLDRLRRAVRARRLASH